MTYEQGIARLKEIMPKLAANLPDGWKLDTSPDAMDNKHYLFFLKGGMKLAIHAVYSEDRFTVSGWGWPFYWEIGGRDGKSKKTIEPRNLYNPQASLDSIGIGMKKDGEQIAADIKRRILPEYERLYARCEEECKKWQEYEDKADKVWREVCALVGTNPQYNSHYVRIGDDNASIENRKTSGKVHISSWDVTPEQLRKMIEALK